MRFPDLSFGGTRNIFRRETHTFAGPYQAIGIQNLYFEMRYLGERHRSFFILLRQKFINPANAQFAKASIISTPGGEDGQKDAVKRGNLYQTFIATICQLFIANICQGKASSYEVDQPTISAYAAIVVKYFKTCH